VQCRTEQKESFSPVWLHFSPPASRAAPSWPCRLCILQGQLDSGRHGAHWGGLHLSHTLFLQVCSAIWSATGNFLSCSFAVCEMGRQLPHQTHCGHLEASVPASKQEGMWGMTSTQNPVVPIARKSLSCGFPHLGFLCWFVNTLSSLIGIEKKSIHYFLFTGWN
jgi:hypothetical protein